MIHIYKTFFFLFIGNLGVIIFDVLLNTLSVHDAMLVLGIAVICDLPAAFILQAIKDWIIKKDFDYDTH